MKSNERPILTIPYSPQEKTLEAVAIGGIFLSSAMLILFWPTLPSLVPSHFDISGAVDAWSDKKVILIFPIVSIILYAGLTILSRYPHIFNYAWPITEQNAQRQYQLARSLLVWLKVEVIVLFTWLEWLTIRVALGQANGLSSLFLPIILVIIFGTIGIYLFQAYHAR